MDRNALFARSNVAAEMVRTDIVALRMEAEPVAAPAAPRARNGGVVKSYASAYLIGRFPASL